jgi:hypothetical protein
MAPSDDVESRSAHVPPAARSPFVAQIVARAQRLVDSRPPGPYQAKWCAEALMVGDATALEMTALASRTD